MTDRVSIAVWNIHRTRGADGRCDAERVIRALIRDLCTPPPDLLVLVEADAEVRPHRGCLDLERIATETGLTSLHLGPNLLWGPESHGLHGVVVLGGSDVVVQDGRLVDLGGVCPRGAVVLDLRLRGHALRCAATHLSLVQGLRVMQMRTLGQALERMPPRPLVLAGDLNEWRPWSGWALSGRVVGRHVRGPSRRTFPARLPVLPLDRVLAEPPLSVETMEAVDTPAIRAASDHLAVRATVRLR
ncbi:Metal-dependent hydrolase, endonuclease/exonuclease/phosphatase family [Roseivivax marinus]|uniref:endonuclease/exonuclease/phosphatase family protein n=1 Tax=Roseivivax marinus TaxID=1379903 RepID=UPI0008C97450|nr:endonuclease/exonuclease/phosphatase family protein [Roseivivax marinus]SEL01447.1 Metal-dependent hydrolase, endonuclease/exonuclease/phosphatase family [Roseivivax marinus]